MNKITRLICCWSLLGALAMLAVPAPASGQFAVGVSITIAPPALPVYDQPPCPGAGFVWVPGYWAWGDDGYYWVPGTWVLAPVGLLWTPGYWSWDGADGIFVWNAGYWAPEVGFYGGIVYGFGYTGEGYEGEYWRNRTFFYNSAVNNVSNTTNITNVYTKTVTNNVTVSNVSYNGGKGGTAAQPTAKQRAMAEMPHTPPTPAQQQQKQAAATKPELRATVNKGKPAVAATPKPGAMNDPGVMVAKAAAPYHPASAPHANAKPATQPNGKRAPPTRTSSPSGKTPIPTSPS